MTANGLIVSMMAILFLIFGYLGVPVAFSLIAGVVIGTLFTPVSLPSIIAQLFNGIDAEPLMAVPFFLLVFLPDVVLWLPKHVFPEAVGCFKNPNDAGYICP